MFCTGCGKQINDSEKFCPNCGKPTDGAVPVVSRSRIASHLRIIGILWLVVSVFRVIPGFVLLSIFHFDFPPDVPFFVHGLLRALGGMFLLGGALGIATGIGLLTHQPWARMLAIVLSVVSLLDIPFGTALGAYTLWALAPAESEQEYRQLIQTA